MWSLDGTAPGPGPILTPDLEAIDGTLTPSPDDRLRARGERRPAPGTRRRAPKNAVLYRVDGGPLKLKERVIGRTTDGWIVGTSEDQVARAVVHPLRRQSDDEPGLAVVKLSRIGWCPSPGKRTTGKATVRIGPVGIGPDKQPAITEVTETRTFDVRDCKTTGVTLSPPSGPWRVEVDGGADLLAERDRPVEQRQAPARRQSRRAVPAALRLARRRDEVGEAEAERERARAGPCARAPCAIETAGPGSETVCGTKNGRSATEPKPAAAQVGERRRRAGTGAG